MSRFWLLLLIFMCSNTQAQWVIYNSSNSPLPDDNIHTITIDKTGVVWIGTENGLAGFDGANWVVLDSSNSGLPVNQIRSLTTDTANNLWVGTFQAGVAIYNGTGWQYINTGNATIADNYIRSIAFDTTGGLWLGSSGGLSWLSDEGWINYNMFNSPLTSNNITHIYVAEDDTKWIGTINGGMVKKDGNSWAVYNTQNSGMLDNTVLDIEHDAAGNVWFTTPAHGLGRYNGTNWFYRLQSNSYIPTNSTTCIAINKATDVKYIGTTDKGLLRWDNTQVFDSFTVVNSPMPNNFVTALQLTSNGKLWIGTDGGGVALFTDTLLSTGITEPASSSKLSATLYPNPVEELLQVAYNQPVLTCQVTDINGQPVPVSNKQQNSNIITIDCSALSSGIYLVSVVSNAGRVVRRFIKSNY
ncbi:MAG: hypothetical protein RLZZ367_598 [Bacteroidota bacterium]